MRYVYSTLPSLSSLTCSQVAVAGKQQPGERPRSADDNPLRAKQQAGQRPPPAGCPQLTPAASRPCSSNSSPPALPTAPQHGASMPAHLLRPVLLLQNHILVLHLGASWQLHLHCPHIARVPARWHLRAASSVQRSAGQGGVTELRSAGRWPAPSGTQHAEPQRSLLFSGPARACCRAVLAAPRPAAAAHLGDGEEGPAKRDLGAAYAQHLAAVHPVLHS